MTQTPWRFHSSICIYPHEWWMECHKRKQRINISIHPSILYEIYNIVFKLTHRPQSTVHSPSWFKNTKCQKWCYMHWLTWFSSCFGILNAALLTYSFWLHLNNAKAVKYTFSFRLLLFALESPNVSPFIILFPCQICRL